MRERTSASLRTGAAGLAGALALFGLWVTSLYSYVLFHSLIELFTIVVAAGVLVIAWNARRYLENNYLLFVGIASGFVALIDLLHTLAYKGMGVFGDHTANLATQLWVASRYLQAAALLAAPAFLGRRLRVGYALAGFAAATLLLLLSIFRWGLFPAAFVEGRGLTAFKQASEYIIATMLVGAAWLLYRKRQAFDPTVSRLLGLYLGLSVISELAFTEYVSVYGGLNLVGHFLRLLAFWALYKAVIETGLVRPHAILLRSLNASQDQMREYGLALEARNEELERSERLLREDAAVLQSRNAELDAFAHTVAHDLKDPLSAMISATSVIRGVPGMPPEKTMAMLERLESTAIGMNQIVDELLLLSQVRKVDAPTGPVDMAGVVAGVLDRLRDSIEERGACIRLPERWPAAIGYGPWLEEVWTNYLSNALKYGGRPPRLELGAETLPSGAVRFWLGDNGPGVPPEARDRLFLPFGDFGARSRMGDGHGHGLGLSIVLQIVTKLGGEVGVDSQAGQGSRFFFTLPGACQAGTATEIGEAASRV